MSQQTNYGTVEAPAAAATPKRRGLIIALCLCTGGALFAVAGPAKAPRLRGTGCPPIVKASATTTPIINTAGGVASQSGGRASDGIYTTGGALSRGTTGAGQGSVPAGLGVSD